MAGREGQAATDGRDTDRARYGRPDGPAAPSELRWERLTALVLGGTGAIGFHLVSALVHRGVAVRVLARSSARERILAGMPIEFVRGDLDDAASVDRALAGCDILFHAAAPYPRTHFHRARQIRAGIASIGGVLDAARRRVPEELLRRPRGHLRQREIEQAEMAALTLRHQPEREAEFRRLLKQPELLDAALEGRLDSSLHPSLTAVQHLPGLKRIVYVSSSTTIARPRGRTVDPVPGQANEWDRHDRIRGSSPYFRMKEEMESAVTRAAVEGLPAVIANPTFCIDTHDAGPTSGKLLLEVARGRMPVYLPGIVNAVATRDVGEALAAAAARGRTGQRYILGGENLRVSALLAVMAEEAGVARPRLAIPLRLAEAIAWSTEAANLLARRRWPLLPVSGVQMLRHSQPFDCRRARVELGMPQTPLRTAVADALRWYRENGYL